MRSLLLLFAVFIVAMPSCLCKDTGKSISNGAKIANNKRNVQLKEGYKIFEEHIKLQQLVAAIADAQCAGFLVGSNAFLLYKL